MKNYNCIGISRMEKKKMEDRRLRIKSILIILILILIAVGFLLGLSASNAEADNRTGNGSTYKYYTSIRVQSGDTLWSIAEEYMAGKDQGDIYDYIEEVEQINHITEDGLIAGNTICIPYYSDELKA